MSRFRVELTRRQIEVINSALGTHLSNFESEIPGDWPFGLTAAEGRGEIAAAENARQALLDQTPLRSWVAR